MMVHERERGKAPCAAGCIPCPHILDGRSGPPGRREGVPFRHRGHTGIVSARDACSPEQRLGGIHQNLLPVKRGVGRHLSHPRPWPTRCRGPGPEGPHRHRAPGPWPGGCAGAAADIHRSSRPGTPRFPPVVPAPRSRQHCNDHSALRCAYVETCMEPPATPARLIARVTKSRGDGISPGGSRARAWSSWASGKPGRYQATAETAHGQGHPDSPYPGHLLNHRSPRLACSAHAAMIS